MSSNIAEIAIDAPLRSTPLDVIPDEILFNVPYGLPMSLERARHVVAIPIRGLPKADTK